MNKSESIYRILIAFMLVDNEIDENEKKVILDFLETKFGRAIPKDKQNILLQRKQMSFESFSQDAQFVYENSYTEDLYEILDFISKMIKSDGKMDPKEIMLFEVLLSKWRIPKNMMGVLGIEKSLWSKFFK